VQGVPRDIILLGVSLEARVVGSWRARCYEKLRKLLTGFVPGSLLMGCTVEATLSVSGGFLVREERTFDHGRLATESLVVVRLVR